MKYKVLNKPYLVGHSCSEEKLFKKIYLGFLSIKKNQALINCPFRNYFVLIS